jgi:uncharacterized membrane protein YfcA
VSLLAWVGAVAIGFVLGLLGSGGSIVTVPVLLYLVHLPEKVAIASSLAIVGSVAAMGGTVAAVRGRVDLRSVALFGVAGLAGTTSGAWLGGFVSGATQLVAFAAVMLLAATAMFRRRPVETEAAGVPARAPLLVLQGAGVGVLTGFVGVGGGFLIVPALVMLGRLPMRIAVGTSLCIIAMNSFIGFWTWHRLLAQDGVHVDWPVIGTFAMVGAVGSIAGGAVAGRMPQRRLQRLFAVMLVVVGAFILWRNLPHVIS